MSLKLKTQRFGQFYCPLSSFFNARRRTIKLSETLRFMTFLASKNPGVIETNNFIYLFIYFSAGKVNVF